MKKCLLLPAGLFVMANLLAQREDVRTLEPFDKISVFGNIEVELIKGDAEKLIASSAEIDLSKISSRVEKEELKINMTSDLFRSSQKVRIRIYYKNFVAISSTGGANIFSEPVIKGERLDLHAASGGNITLDIDLKQLEASVGEGSVITLNGNVGYQKVTATSGGAYSAFELIGDDAVVKANTGGKIKVYAGHLLDATASTKGYVGYRGSPEKTNFSSNLGGEIKADE